MEIKGQSCLISVCICGRKRGSTIVVVQLGLALILHTFYNVTNMAWKEKLVVFILKKSPILFIKDTKQASIKG